MNQTRRTVLENIDGVAVVRFVDRELSDEAIVRQVGEELCLLIQDGFTRFLLNCQNLEHLSSAGIGKFIKLDEAVKRAGGKLVLCAVAPTILHIFKATGLDERFDCATSLSNGLSILNG